MERRFRSLTAIPGMEYFREEGIARPSDPFGSSELALQSVVPELHISEIDGQLSFALSNPLRHGPVVVVHGGMEDMLIPGETLCIQDQNCVVLAKGPGGVIEMILLDHADVMPLKI